MRRTLPIVGAILLASFGLSSAKPNAAQEKPGSTEPKMTPEDAAKRTQSRRRRKDCRKCANSSLQLRHVSGKAGDGKGDLAADMKLELAIGVTLLPSKK